MLKVMEESLSPQKKIMKMVDLCQPGEDCLFWAKNFGGAKTVLPSPKKGRFLRENLGKMYGHPEVP